MVGWHGRFAMSVRLLTLSDVVIQLQIMTARTEDHADRQGAGQVNTLSAVVLGLWVDVSGEREAGIQQGPVGIAFGALPINLESQ